MLPKPLSRRPGVFSILVPPVSSVAASRVLERTRSTPFARRWNRRLTRPGMATMKEHGDEDGGNLHGHRDTWRTLHPRTWAFLHSNSGASRNRGPRLHNPPLISQVVGQPPGAKIAFRYFRAQESTIGQSIRAYSSEKDNYLVDDDPDPGVGKMPGVIFTDPVVFSPKYRTTMRAVHILKMVRQPYESTETTRSLFEAAENMKPIDQLPFLDKWWIQITAQFAAQWDKRLPAELRVSHLNVNASTEQTVNCLFRDGTKSGAILNVWTEEMRPRLSSEAKRLVFCESLLWIIANKHDATLNYIEAIGSGQKAMSYIVADAFEFLADRLHASDKPLPAKYYSLLTNKMDAVPRLATTLSQKLVHRVLKSASLDQARKFWQTCRTHGFRPSLPTLLGAAYRFACLGDHEMSTKLLKDSVRSGMKTASPAVAYVAKAILRFSAVKSQAYSAGLQILQLYADLGMVIDSQLVTIHIHNAMEAGDLRSALRFYDRMRDAGMEVNDYTYTIVLSGLKRAVYQDFTAMRLVLVQAMDALPSLERPHYVATEILHHTYLQRFKFQTMEDGKKLMIANRKAFYAVAQTYCKYFDPQPLRYLGVPEEFLGSQPPELPMETTPPPVRLTIAAFLHYVAYTSPDDLPRLFDSFVDKLKRGDDPQLAELVATNHIYNAFLMALCENESTLAKIPDVLVHMVDREIHRVPMTTVQTWNILITGFLRHKQTAAVHRVTKIMADLNEEPNELTWNSLVQGWLRNEEVEMAIQAMKKMERKKILVNDKTLAHIAFSKKGPKIMEALKVDEEDYLVPEDSEEPLEGDPVKEQQGPEDGHFERDPPRLINRVYV